MLRDHATDKVVLGIGRAIVTAVAIGIVTSPAAAQDVGHGKQVFQQCSACHLDSGEGGMGPSLHGVVGRKAGSQPGYAYSAAMKRAGFIWAPATLDAFLRSPQKLVPGTKMPYGGLADDKDRHDLVTFLKGLK